MYWGAKTFVWILYYYICFIAMVWKQTFNITEVCLNAIWDLIITWGETIQTISETSGKII